MVREPEGTDPMNVRPIPQDVLNAVGKEVDLILDAGKTPGEKGSTVLDMTVEPPRVVREGMVSRELLRGCIDLRDDKE